MDKNEKPEGGDQAEPEATPANEDQLKAEPDEGGGYKRPPKHSQWKPGQSGNPGGRTTKPLTFMAIVEEVSSETTAFRGPNGERTEASLSRALLLKLFNEALKGSVAAARVLIPLLREAPSVGRRPMTVKEYTDQEIANLTREELGLLERIKKKFDAAPPYEGPEIDVPAGPTLNDDDLMPEEWPPRVEDDPTPAARTGYRVDEKDDENDN
jgi:hypothetical protein